MRANRLLFFVVTLTAVATLAACGKRDDAPAATSLTAPATAAPEASSTSAAPATAFDLNSIPLSSAALPPFPWLDWPPAVPEGERRASLQKNFDSYTLIAGEQFLPVEGRVEKRTFSIPDSMSQLEVRRNYANLIKSLSGVQINGFNPTTDSASVTKRAQEIAGENADVAKLLDLSRYDEGKYEYESFVIRTTGTVAWIVLQSSQHSVSVTTIEQQAMQQTIGLVTADAMKQALDTAGRIALYINFDTDAATLRPDAAAVISEITQLLQANPDLKIAVEGHTDNTGTAARNSQLSQQRAAAVVAALTATGVAGTRLSAQGFGQDKPLADNGTDEGRARNRRVELVKR
jgi:OmpA-OmpF porin, OOP family